MYLFEFELGFLTWRLNNFCLFLLTFDFSDFHCFLNCKSYFASKLKKNTHLTLDAISDLKLINFPTRQNRFKEFLLAFSFWATAQTTQAYFISLFFIVLLLNKCSGWASQGTLSILFSVLLVSVNVEIN